MATRFGRYGKEGWGIRKDMYAEQKDRVWAINLRICVTSFGGYQPHIMLHVDACKLRCSRPKITANTLVAGRKSVLLSFVHQRSVGTLLQKGVSVVLGTRLES